MIIRQHYDVYTSDDREVWRLLYGRQIERLRDRVCPQYFDGLHAIGLTADEIPRFETMNARLKATTGWQLSAVDGWLSSEDYFTLISDRIFPSTTTLRSMDEIEHSKQPDMFHDTFGHAPLLTLPIYSDFLVEMSHLALQRPDDAEWMKMISWAYKWTVEYGLMQTDQGLRVYGAGLISSSKELEYVLAPVAGKRPFTAEGVLSTSHTPASLQPNYFVADSFDQLRNSVGAIESVLREWAPASSARH